MRPNFFADNYFRLKKTIWIAEKP